MVRVVGCLWLTALLWAGFTPTARLSEGPAPLPFRLHDDGSIVVPVSINGQGPFRFMIDTGSTRSAVSGSVARRIRSHAVAATLLLAPAGAISRLVTRLTHVSIGDIDAASLDATLLPDADLRRHRNVDGLIGQDVLARLAYTIDYRDRRIFWHRNGRATIAESRLRLDAGTSGLLVRLPPSGEQPAVRLIPDTGADALVLFGSAGLLRGVTQLGVARLRTLTGERLARHVMIDAFDVGAIRLHNQPALLVPDTGGDHAALGDGLLPLHLFARVTFDVPRGWLTLEPR